MMTMNDKEPDGEDGVDHGATILTRHRFLARLPRLTSLAIGRCGGWTARVWDECLAQCGESIEYLSLTGWGRDADTRREAAVARCLSGMRNLRELELIDFWIGEGVVRGVGGLRGRLARLTVTVVRREEMGLEEAGWDRCGGDVVGLVNAACVGGKKNDGGVGAMRQFVWNLPFELRESSCEWIKEVRTRIRKESEEGLEVTFGFQ